MSLFEKQKSIQEMAFKVVKELNLEKILGKYGEFVLVGSVVYGLMTWRDVDMDLRLPDIPTDKQYFELVSSIFPLLGIKKLTLVDDRKMEDKDRPRSMYLGIKYEDNDKNIWKIDIRILSKEDVTTDVIADLISSKATNENKETILRIKSQVHDNPNYHKKFSSVDIYEAVLNSGVNDLEQFKEYLNIQGKEL